MLVGPSALDERLLHATASERILGQKPLNYGRSSCLLRAFAYTGGAFVLVALTMLSSSSLRRPLSSSSGMPMILSRGDDRPGAEIALVNFIRHGERSQDPSDTGLTQEGRQRAAYLGRCIGSVSEPTLAFPLGPPTALLASEHASSGPTSIPKISTRPADTLRPIQERLLLPAGVELASAASLTSVQKSVQRLRPGETLLVAWQHDFIPSLVNSLRPPAPTLIRAFPMQCNSSHYEEPAYTLDDPGGYCYDIVWQVVLQRPQPQRGEQAKPWHAVALSQLHQGFAGDGADARECREALAPLASGSALYGALAHRSGRPRGAGS